MTYEVSNFPWMGSRDYVLGNYNNASYLGLWFTSESTLLTKTLYGIYSSYALL
jgi:hypothetical protein